MNTKKAEGPRIGSSAAGLWRPQRVTIQFETGGAGGGGGAAGGAVRRGGSGLLLSAVQQEFPSKDGSAAP
jgi:hypothetical protein